MSKLTALVPVLLLAGCTTTADMLARAPDYVYESNLSVDGFVACGKGYLVDGPQVKADQLRVTPLDSGIQQLEVLGSAADSILVKVGPNVHGAKVVGYAKNNSGRTMLFKMSERCGKV